MANFNIDQNGNMWIGTNVSDTFSTAQSDANTKFYVESDGTIKAEAGSVGGIIIDADGIESSNFDASTNTGWRLDNTTGIAQYFDIDIVLENTASGSPSATQRIDIGNSQIFDLGNQGLTVSTTALRTSKFKAIAVGSASNPPIAIAGDYAELGFFATNDTSVGGFTTMHATNGTSDVFHWNSTGTNVTFHGDVVIEGNQLSVNGDTGGNNQFLGYNGSGTLGFHTISGSSHPDSDHTSFLTQTTGDGRYVLASSHSHSGFVNHVDTSSGGSGGTDALTIASDGGIRINFGTTGTRVAVGDHTHSSSNVSVSAGAVTSNAGYFLRTLSASNNVITYNRSDFGSGLKMNSQRPTSNNSSSVGISTIEYNEMHSRNGNFTFVYGANLGSSSQEIKTDITDLDLGLDFINDLSPKKYKYVSQVKEDDGKYGFGFIAEDIEQVLVDNSETGSKLFVEGRDDYSSYGRCAHELICTCEDEDCCSYPTETYDADTGEHTSTEGCMFDAKCVQPCCTDIAGATIDGINYVHATEAECEEEFIVSQKYPSLKYDELIAPAVKAIQELSTQISDLTARVEALEG